MLDQDRAKKLERLANLSRESGDRGSELAALKAIKAMKDGQSSPAQSEGAQAEQPQPEPQESLAGKINQASINVGAGLVRGAGSIGNAIVSGNEKLNEVGAYSGSQYPILPLIAKATSSLMNQSPGAPSNYEQRKTGMDGGLEAMGAEPESYFYKGGKIASEVAGTLGVGGAISKVAGAIPYGAPLAQMIKQGGMGKSVIAETGILPTVKSLAMRAAGGGIAGGGATALVSPENTGTGAAIGAALPAPLKVLGAGASTIGSFAAKAKGGVEKMLMTADDVAAKKTSDSLVSALERSGMNTGAASREMTDMGNEAMLADVSPTFQNLLGSIGRKSSSVAGTARAKLEARQVGQAARLGDALDEATGTGGVSISSYLDNVDQQTKPAIKLLYQKAAGEMSAPIPALDDMMAADSSIGKAAAKAAVRMKDKIAGGQEVTPFDQINTTKQILDDRITTLYRAGKNNQARDLVILKNNFLSTADENIPSFKEARNLFAGRSHLDEAAKNGEMFLRIPASDVQAYVQGLGQSEKATYVLAAKKAILDRIDNTQSGADAARKLFGKNGDADKMKALFNTPEDFTKFKSDLQRESKFMGTNRQFQGSQTAERLEQDASGSVGDLSMLGIAKSAVTFGSKAKEAKATDIAYRKLGDLLTKKGLTLEDLMASIQKQKVVTPPVTRNYGPAVSTISALSAGNQ